MKAIVVAGTHSGVGKTTITLALIAALRARGRRVAVFKAGPDFIDAAHLTWAAECDCVNLDGWMLGRAGCQQSFARAAAGAEVAVIEGMMGLFDGASGESERGSTAEIAKWLGVPVLLVTDAAGAARSLAATVHGFRTFDPELRVAAAVCNRVGGDGHAAYLQQAVTATALAGCCPAEAQLHIPERHLGLTLPGEISSRARREALAEWGERYLDVDGILAAAAELHPQPPSHMAAAPPRVRLGVARDAAFCFYYAENLALLRQAGAELIEFSPLRDAALPERLDGVYLGGGYPELYAGELSANAAMRAELGEFAGRGGFIYAECGGLMYLAQQLTTTAGETYAMAGVLECGVAMQPRLAAIGYREVTPVGLGLGAEVRARGHEFHHSRLAWAAAGSQPAHLVHHGDDDVQPEGFRAGPVVASYIHLHFGSCNGLAAALVVQAEGARRELAGTPGKTAIQPRLAR